MNRKYTKFLIIVFLLLILYLFYNDSNTSSYTNASLMDENNFIIEVLDVGQADSILIKSDNEYALIDAGNKNDSEGLLNYFEEKNINNFKYVFVTHPHEDHIGSMSKVIDNFNISEFYMPNVITNTKVFENVLLSLKNKNMNFKVPKENEILNLGNAIIKVIYTGEDKNNLNNSSIILKIEYGNNSFLFMGDAEEEIEDKIIDKNINADVLKVAHHGSEYSTSLKFLNKVNPKYAIISVGEENIYNHPSNKILNRLKSKNIEIFRTDTVGTIVINSDGENIKIESKRTNINGE